MHSASREFSSVVFGAGARILDYPLALFRSPPAAPSLLQVMLKKLRPALLLLPLCVAAFILMTPASPRAQTSDWTFCASEGGSCSFSGTSEVRYGASGAYVYKTLTGSTPCSNAVFGDPAPGVAKSCAVTSSEWRLCAFEGGFCGFSGTKDVRYGANGSYV